MKNIYTNEIAELKKWVENANQQLKTGFSFLHNEVDVQAVYQRIFNITILIQEE